MDKEHVKGAADKAKGAVNDALGKMTGDKKMQVEGKVDKAKGAAHEALRVLPMKPSVTSRTPHVKPTNANLDARI